MINRRCFTFGLLSAACLGLTSCTKPQSETQTPTTTEAKPSADAVEFEIINQYFVKNTVQPEPGKTQRQGICQTQAEFDALFGLAALNQENQFLPEDYFDSHVVIYYIQWGDTPWEYQVESLTVDQNELKLHFTRSGEPSKSAAFSPCLLLGIDKSIPHASLSLNSK